MSGKEKDNLDDFINNAQKLLEEFVLEREHLNSKIKNYIISFQSFDSEIYNMLFDAREFYSKKRNNYNIKLEKLKRKQIEYERLWNDLTKKLKTLQKPELSSDISTLIEYNRQSLEDIEDKIDNMTKTLDEQILDIEEENEIIDKIRELENNKQNKINLLAEMEHNQVTKLQSSDYYINYKKKEAIEKDLKEIYENLIKFSNKRRINHKKMLELCRKVKQFENIKKQMENKLIENKTYADSFHQLFLKLMNENRKVLLEQLSNKGKSKVRPKKIPKSRIRTIIKKKKKNKKLEQKKLAIALDKQKAGKKLDFYELKLILKHSKNKKI